METKRRIYKTFAGLIPRFYRDPFSEMLVYSGEKTLTVDDWLGSTIILSMLSFVAVILIAPMLYGYFSIIHLAYALGLAVFIFFMVYLVIYFKMEDRTERVDRALPDALQLMAANIRAGMTPFQAMKLSARKEFGPLKEEIEYATTKALGAGSFSDTLGTMGERVNSEVLDHSMKLFTSSLKSGGHVAQLLEETSRDITETRSLKKELTTSTKTYTMFILFTVLVGAPFLFAISVKFLEVITKMQSATGAAASSSFGIGGLVGVSAITPDFLTKVAVVVIILTSVLASAMIGVIQEGKEKYGLKYAPFIAAGGLLLFYGARYMIGGFFSGII